MNLQIRSVADKGNLEKERMVLDVLGPVDVGNFLLMQTGFLKEKGVTIQVHHAYWFPYKKVSTGDLVVLYTKIGTAGEKPIALDKEKTAYFFYWGLRTAIWKSEDRAAVLLHAPEWVSKRPDEI